MKASGAIAVLLSASLPTGAFAQNISAASRAGSAASSSASGAAGTIQIVPSGAGALAALSLGAPSIVPSLTPAPGIVPSISPDLTPLPGIAPSALVSAVQAAPAATVPDGEGARLPHAVKSSPFVPAALLAAPAAPAKHEKPGDSSWTDRLAEIFDGGAPKQEPVVFVIRHGKPAIKTTPSLLPQVLAAEGLDRSMAREGQIRLITAPEDAQAPVPSAEALAALKLKGIKIQFSEEKLAVDWKTQPSDAAQAGADSSANGSENPVSDVKPGVASRIGAALAWPFREARFLGRTFTASLVKPLPSEIIGGIVTKSIPLVTSIGVYWATVGPSHPFAFAGLIALSLTQEVFHGFYLKSWNNFQESLRRLRGFNYQMFFNLAYMQGFGTLYRLLSWTADPKNVTPPWSVGYWKDMALMSVVGTFFGVLGYNGLNTLYSKGAIKRWQHSGIQQLRDLFFLLAGPFFASGSMTAFWIIFLVQQSLDLSIALWGWKARTRPMVYVTSEAVAASPEFAAKYPLSGEAEVNPLKLAFEAMLANPLVRLLTWPARTAWKLARGGRK